MRPQRIIVVVLGCLLAAQLLACKPKKEHSAPIDTASWIVHLPSDSDFAAGLRPREVMSSPLWKQYGGHVLASYKTRLEGVKKLCNLDLLSAIDTAVMAVNSDKLDEVTLILRGVKRSKALSCTRAIAKNQRAEIEIREEGALTTITWGETVQVLAWLDSKTVLVVPGKSDAAWYADRIAGRDGLTANSAWKPLGEVVDTASSLWLYGAYDDSSALGAAVVEASAGVPSEAAYASIHCTDGIAVKAGMRFSGNDVAKGMHFLLTPSIALFRAALGEAGPVMDKVALEVEGTQMLASVTLSASELELFSREFGPTANISPSPAPGPE